MNASHDLYAILGVSGDATNDQIRKAYRMLAMRHHPDRNPENTALAETRFKNIQHAYETLIDPDRRAQYHETLDALRRPGKQRQADPQAEPGEDARCGIAIPLEVAAFGGRCEVTTKVGKRCRTCQGNGTDPDRQNTCPDCRGWGWTAVGFMRSPCLPCQGTGQLKVKCRACMGRGLVRRTRTVVVGVPAGVVDGMVVRVVEGGSDSKGDGAPGSLYCTVSIALHPRYRVEGRDLHADLTLDFVTAVLGGHVEVQTIWGPVTAQIPELTRAGDIIRIEARGLPDRRSGEKGDLLLRASLDLPEDLTTLNALQRSILKMWFY